MARKEESPKGTELQVVTNKHEKLSKEMIDNIRNYKNKITSKESFRDAVREMPGMYIGRTGNPGFIAMIREIIQNALDEVLRPESPCNKVIVSYDENTHEILIEDNGSGIPHDLMIKIFMHVHTSSNYDKKNTGEVITSGRHGVGSKVVLALSRQMFIESYILGVAKRMEFNDGIATTEEPIDIPCENRQGTLIGFAPTYDIMGQITVSKEDVLDLLKELSIPSKIGTTIIFNYVTKSGKHGTEVIVNTDGLLAPIIDSTNSPLIAPIFFSRSSSDGFMFTEGFFTFDIEFAGQKNIHLYGNYCPITDGSHLTGFMNAVTKFFRDYMNKIYIPANSKIKIKNSDVAQSIILALHAGHAAPTFTGQAKNILSNEDLQPFTESTVTSRLEEWSKSNPVDLQKVCKFLKELAEIRMKSEDGKLKIVNTYKANPLNNYPDKYEPPRDMNSDELELIIVEGDSAKGPAINYRCPKRQGIFPLRGKIPNAYTTPKEKILANAEISGLIKIIGAGYGKSFDISKVKFKRVIIMTDADADGAHIRLLLNIFFIVYMPQLYTHGIVHAAVPPLYGFKKNKKDFMFFSDKLEYIGYVQKEFAKNYTIMSLDGTKLSQSSTFQLLISNDEYVYTMDTVAKRYALNPILLEFVLSNRNLSLKELKSAISKEFRFLNTYKEKETIIVSGLLDDKFQNLFLHQRLINDSIDIINYIESINECKILYLLNGEKTSLYGLMKVFEKSAPTGIKRYKGLGEMNGPELGISTIHPDKERTIVQYTIDNIKEETRLLAEMQADKAGLIKTIGKISRAQLLG